MEKSEMDNTSEKRKTSKNKINKSLSALISLRDYIEKHKLKIGDKNITHQWWDNKKNINFRIDDSEYYEFLKIYYNEYKNTGSILHIMEQPREFGPLCLDYDIKHKTSERIINKDIIAGIVAITNGVIKKYFNVRDEDDIRSYVLTKDEPFFDKKKNKYSDGFHIQYPNLILSSNDRFIVFNESRKEIIERNILEDIYNCLFDEQCEDSEYDNSTIDSDYSNSDKISVKTTEDINKEIFDPSIIVRNKWFLYNSGKNIDGELNYYKLNCIFDFNAEEIECEQKEKDIIKLLSIRKPDNEENQTMPNEEDEEYINALREVNEKYIKKKDIITSSNVIITNTDGKDSKDNKESGDTDKDNKDNIEFAKKLVKMLSPKRAGPYDEWISVGWALYNISSSLYTEFEEFSKKSKKFSKEGCRKVWDDCSRRYSNYGYNIASLVKWAKEDNNEEYKKILREKMNLALDKGDLTTDFDVACVIKEIYKYEYKCSSISKGIWWQFENHRWNRIDNTYTLSIKMSTEVAKEFAVLQGEITKLYAVEYGPTADKLGKKSKDIMALIKNLKKGSFKKKVIEECANIFYEKHFESKLDQNNYLVGFKNGIYDLRNKNTPDEDGNIIYEPFGFRNGQPDDYISKTTDYDYVVFDENHRIIREITTFIESVQPDEDMRNYLMAYCASFFEGSNKDQKFMIWTGVGQNSKGSLIDLLDKTFNGDSDGYFGTLPPTILTQKRGSSSSATPELADKFGKRVITLQEPEGEDKIHVGFMKNITGQDKIEARPLYGDPFQYTPQFKLLLACNHLPNIPSDDGGTWRRIRVINFGVTFCSNPTKPNEKKSDPELREKLKYWKQGFAWLLINKYYPMYVINKGLDKLEPEDVKKATGNYKNDSNVFLEFFNELCVSVTGSEEPIVLFASNKNNGEIDDSLWGAFKSWHKNAYTDKKMLGRKNLVEYLKNNGYEIAKDGCVYRIDGEHRIGIKCKV